MHSLPPIGKTFSVALVQLGYIGENKAKNLKHARLKISEAVRPSVNPGCNNNSSKPDIVVLPEVFNSPYSSKHFDKYAEVVGWHESKRDLWNLKRCPSESIKMLSSAAKEENVWIFGGSIPERSPENPRIIYNSSPVFSPDGKLVALHRKLHLFDIDIPGGITFKESETLSPGQSPVTVVETPFGKIGLGICYDIRFPEMGIIATRKGCIAMIYPGAFNLTTGPLHWELLQRARAVDNQIYVITCSPARDPQSDYQAWGHSSIIDPMARVVSTTDETESIVYGIVDFDEIVKARTNIPILNQKRYDVYPDIGSLVEL
ncbi:nitrilase [Phakopsora pachyrhizi]|nr:nitrilase [Phakopsora pachyrhizi]